MLILVCYDVSTVEAPGRRRLARVAKACENYGQRVQRSVFECQVDETQLHLLRRSLLERIKPEEDNLRFYRIGEPVEKHREEYGCFRAFDFEKAIVI